MALKLLKCVPYPGKMIQDGQIHSNEWEILSFLKQVCTISHHLQSFPGPDCKQSPQLGLLSSLSGEGREGHETLS